MGIKDNTIHFFVKNREIFLKIGVAGFILSLIVHLTTFLKSSFIINFPFVWILHTGIFLVWFPAIISLRQGNKGYRGFNFWSIVTNGAPKWMKVLGVIVAAYAFFNFFYTSELSGPGVPSESNGRYVMANHGDIVKELTEEEYIVQENYLLRGFSGHWIAFYFIGVLLLYSSLKSEKIKHTVSQIK